MKNFETTDLFAPLQRALAEQNYQEPTPIQFRSIPPAIEGLDILGCAQTGTGKTAAFALPILDYLGHEQPPVKANQPVALVLAPTRELAIQIADSFRTYGKHMRFRQALVYGGVGQGEQVKALRRGVHVLIATPGRLLDLMDQGHVDLRDVEIFVLDEADRMLDMGFMIGANLLVENPEARPQLGSPGSQEQVSQRESKRGRRPGTLKSESRNGTQRGFRRVNKKQELARANKHQRSAIA